ncbi:MAG: TetR family transcriptional regulator [Microbacteriaceae bacterium]|jgi:AcrR family transcriptional regulator|nr:TetR family transcriptional regulator [Microbacteriaceae bacterium]
MTTLAEEHSEDIGLRERKKQQTRFAIHEAAFRLVDAQGLEATTVEQICQEADVSARTFFNYYPSKAAAALEMRGTAVDPLVRSTFLSARGGLVAALCAAIGSTAELGRSQARMKHLMTRHPELMVTLSRMMLEVRGQFVALAAERAATTLQAELAVTLVMAALSRVMHDDSGSDRSMTEQLKATIDGLVGVVGEKLLPARSDIGLEA